MWISHTGRHRFSEGSKVYKLGFHLPLSLLSCLPGKGCTFRSLRCSTISAGWLDQAHCTSCLVESRPSRNRQGLNGQFLIAPSALSLRFLLVSERNLCTFGRCGLTASLAASADELRLKRRLSLTMRSSSELVDNATVTASCELTGEFLDITLSYAHFFSLIDSALLSF